MEKIIINANPQNLVINTDEILYIATLKKRALLVKVNGEEKRINISLQKLYEKLESNGFIRCHKSYIVNEKYIESFNKNSCVLKYGIIVPRGRYYNNHFKEKLYSCV